MTRTMASAKKAGSSFERQVADYPHEVLDAWHDTRKETAV